jgi:enoyl-CoA hydratase/carnithine racemase
MMEHVQSSFYQLELPDQGTDGEILIQVKRALREADQFAAVAITGSFEPDVTDVTAHRELISLLLDASLPVFAFPSGPIGQRGLALLLAADRVIFGPEASITEDWRACPGVTPLLHHRFGPLLARTMLFNCSADPIALLLESGFAARAVEPSTAQDMITDLENGLGRQFKRALRASSEMPLKEALNFDLWFARNPQGNAP